MEIRRWAVDDLPEINALLLELAGAVGIPYHGSVDLLRRHFGLADTYRDMYSDYVSVVDGSVVGFVSLVYYSSALHKKGTALINELVVDNRFRGQGVGRSLLQYCITEARAKGFDEIEVGAEPDNVRAIAFYKQNGLSKQYVLLGMEFGE